MEFVVSTIIAAVTLLFTVIKHIHEKKESRRNTEFEQFRQVIDRVAGRYLDGTLMVDVQQISAVYQLLEFKRFNHISIPVLLHYMNRFAEGDNSSFRIAVEDVYHQLS
ncbi:hypothetical protein ACFOQM_07130 [Paenibacillus sp. GCM10012307]|uniref:Uncharacterized protein n=1 Tax=Paenibacillus roseus TaxID=2798579 RepID=A0A934J634_9BACL|nr:hypothetical protein [Paenibacillus roseus]MBJ6361070.1 hypothetical protein [Paenibacillus roseus]